MVVLTFRQALLQLPPTLMALPAVWGAIVIAPPPPMAALITVASPTSIRALLVVTAPGSGAEIIPFLKTWVNLPMAIGFTIMYAKLANVLSNEALFYTVIFPFIAFFGAFAFVLYPMQDVLHPTGE